MGDGYLQRIEAVVQRQHTVPPERDDHIFFFEGQRCRTGDFAINDGIIGIGPFFPFGDCLRIDAVASGQVPNAVRAVANGKADLRGRYAVTLSFNHVSTSGPPNGNGTSWGRYANAFQRMSKVCRNNSEPTSMIV